MHPRSTKVEIKQSLKYALGRRYTDIITLAENYAHKHNRSL